MSRLPPRHWTAAVSLPPRRARKRGPPPRTVSVLRAVPIIYHVHACPRVCARIAHFSTSAPLLRHLPPPAPPAANSRAPPPHPRTWRSPSSPPPTCSTSPPTTFPSSQRFRTVPATPTPPVSAQGNGRVPPLAPLQTFRVAYAATTTTLHSLWPRPRQALYQPPPPIWPPYFSLTPAANSTRSCRTRPPGAPGSALSRLMRPRNALCWPRKTLFTARMHPAWMLDCAI